MTSISPQVSADVEQYLCREEFNHHFPAAYRPTPELHAQVRQLYTPVTSRVTWHTQAGSDVTQLVSPASDTVSLSLCGVRKKSLSALLTLNVSSLQSPSLLSLIFCFVVLFIQTLIYNFKHLKHCYRYFIIMFL